MSRLFGSSETDYFNDRFDAGRRLASMIADKGISDNVLVLGLPRGGVPVAYEVARKLKAPLDIWLVRKLGVPGHEELAMGALASGGTRVVNEDIVRSMEVAKEDFDKVIARETSEIERREKTYRGDKPMPEIKGRTVIVVDDGLATGASMKAALRSLSVHNPARIIAAVPVGAPDTCRLLSRDASEVICMRQPRFMDAVGRWYLNFEQTTDEEVRELLERAEAEE